jgi:hypothetical protein
MSTTLTTRDKVRRTGIAVFVVACAVGVGVAISSTTEIDANGDPIPERRDPCDVDVSGDVEEFPVCDPQEPVGTEVVERLFPPRNSEALQHVQMGVDLGTGYTGTLVVEGQEVPVEQIDERPELNQLFFSPGEGQLIDEWRAGRNCVAADYWRISEGPDGESSGTIEWCFDVL